MARAAKPFTLPSTFGSSSVTQAYAQQSRWTTGHGLRSSPAACQSIFFVMETIPEHGLHLQSQIRRWRQGKQSHTTLLFGGTISLCWACFLQFQLFAQLIFS